MSINSLLRQTITLYNKSSFNAYGREEVGSGSSVSARFEVKRKTVRLANDQVATIDAFCFVPADTTININDRVDYDSVSYKVFGKEKVIGGTGRVSHLEIMLTKWQTT